MFLKHIQNKILNFGWYLSIYRFEPKCISLVFPILYNWLYVAIDISKLLYGRHFSSILISRSGYTFKLLFYFIIDVGMLLKSNFANLNLDNSKPCNSNFPAIPHQNTYRTSMIQNFTVYFDPLPNLNSSNENFLCFLIRLIWISNK